MEKLRTWRLAQDKTAAEIGAMVGVSGVHWTRYETGERKVSINKLHDVSKLTGIPADELRPDIFKAIEGAA